jgi:hypothetical protein
MARDNNAGSDDLSGAGALDGASSAAVLAGGVGAFAVGIFVILNEAGLYAAPSLYGPAGGVSGRTTFATATWLISWAILHGRWKSRRIEPGPVIVTTLVLLGLGLLATFPPLWAIF